MKVALAMIAVIGAFAAASYAANGWITQPTPKLETLEISMKTQGDRVNAGVAILTECIEKSRLGASDGVTTLQAYWADRLAILACVEEGNQRLGLSDDDIDPADDDFISQADLLAELETKG
jgi:hypothetical protein